MDEKELQATVTIWFFSEYNPIIYKNAVPYHEAEFYCLKFPDDGTVLKIANHLIIQIKEEWDMDSNQPEVTI
jgi:hypothetical protein